jgi:hypothetical protein
MPPSRFSAVRPIRLTDMRWNTWQITQIRWEAVIENVIEDIHQCESDPRFDGCPRHLDIHEPLSGERCDPIGKREPGWGVEDGTSHDLNDDDKCEAADIDRVEASLSTCVECNDRQQQYIHHNRA